MAKRPKYGGRRAGTPNKATREIKDLARLHGPAMVKELARLALKAESEQARVAAIREMFDRGYGKASQSHQHSGPGGGPITTMDLTKATDEQIAALEAIFGPLAESGGGDGGDQGGEGEAGD
jgi:hypothetical protein